MSLIEIAEIACATVIFVWSPLFSRVRQLAPGFLTCAMCVGVWAGFVFGAVARINAEATRIFLDACAVGVAAWLIYLVGKALDDL